jgi:hydroxymethylpyrimidine pyrophosphatase-like HAD family hydrolase
LINSVSSIDILPKGFTKAVGLGLLLDAMGGSKADMIFVGDGLFPGGNDYSVYEAGIETIAVQGPDETAQIIKEWIG